MMSSMQGRFVIIVLDGFGIGAMKDTISVRKQDQNTNTLKSILKDFPSIKLPNLEKLGLMNAYGFESEGMKFNDESNFGKMSLMHFGADTYMGHQEIMGTLPKQPEVIPFQNKIDEIEERLKTEGYKVERKIVNKLCYLVCNDYVTIADNLEADLGTCYNITAPLDYISFEEVYKIGTIVRQESTVNRVIVFGGTGNNIQDLYNAVEIKLDKFIGIASAKSKSYNEGYQCRHLGYGVDAKVQVPSLLKQIDIPTVLIGKVADIVANTNNESYSCVPTHECMELTCKMVEKMEKGFICTNIQETDLAGHSQDSAKYKEILEIADAGIGKILLLLNDEDILIVQADHGNDPNNGNSKHTREYVPLLVYKKNVKGKRFDIRNTLSDIGATVCDYFNAEMPENGESFLNSIISE